MKKSARLVIGLVFMLSSFVVFHGCVGGSEESIGSSTGGTATDNVGDAACSQCHASVLDPLTGEGIVAQYESTSPHRNSSHANNGNGCEACHGGGSDHFGVGSIPYPNPYADNGMRCASCHKGKYATNAPTKFADSRHAAGMTLEEDNPCRRCHTNQGAILGAQYGLTGPKDVLENQAYQAAVPASTENTAFKCETCHQHGAGLRTVMARDAAGNVVKWNPSRSSKVNDQFNLCTSCHNLKTYDGSKVMASGTAASGTVMVGRHENSWYRIIATTHLNNADNPAAGGISGYVIRVNGENPCFDCHRHEAKTNTNKQNPNVTTGGAAYDPLSTTNHTEWAKAAHSGRLLTAKIAAAGANPRTVEQVDAVMNAIVSPAPFLEYDWSAPDRQACQRCHTATGASNFLNNPSAYDQTKNDYSHLAGWTESNKSSKQREVIYCWACHSNVSEGLLRNPGAFTAPYNFQGAPAKFPDIEASNVCVPCHSGRESGESLDSITDFTNVGFRNSHYRSAAGLMYVKSGFIAFVDPNTPIGNSTYGKSLTSTDDGGAISSTHRKFGTKAINGDSHNPSVFVPGFMDSGGPCVTCHMTAAGQPNRITSHSWAINADAFNQVCINCHDSEGGVPLTAENFRTVFLVPQEEVFQDALNLAAEVLLQKFNIRYVAETYPYFYDLTKDPSGKTAVRDWTRGGTVDGKKLMGACFNINLLKRDPGTFAHARTYTRRLIYDTIDFLDDRTINLSTGTTALATMPSVYGKGATAYTDGTLTTLAPGTTEAMTYIIGWSRSTGAWNAIERP